MVIDLWIMCCLWIFRDASRTFYTYYIHRQCWSSWIWYCVLLLIGGDDDVDRIPSLRKFQRNLGYILHYNLYLQCVMMILDALEVNTECAQVVERDDEYASLLSVVYWWWWWIHTHSYSRNSGMVMCQDGGTSSIIIMVVVDELYYSWLVRHHLIWHILWWFTVWFTVRHHHHC